MTSPALSEQSLVGAFALLLIAISLIYGILFFVVASLVGFEMPAHAVNVLALMGAAMMVGNQDSERSGRCPGKAPFWRLATWFTLLNTLLALIALAFYAGVAQWLNRPGESGVDLGLVGDTDMAAVVQYHRRLLPALIAVLTLLWLFVGRLALYLSARSTEKHGERQAAKAARRSR